MKLWTVPLAIIVCIAASGTGSCQTPPNDNFANRIVLTGNDITFAGTLDGATREPGEPQARPFNSYIFFQRSVWWTWTATDTTPVTLVALSYSADVGTTKSAISVYPGTNIFGIPQPTPTVAGMWLDAGINKLSFTFQATAGVTYQIQFGDDTFYEFTTNITMSFQLIATNAPVILEPPTPQTISPGGSALFTVLATGVFPISYQWLSNGVPVPGETRPMLALDNITADQAGDYSVIVSNSTGTVTSPAAALAVSSNIVSPFLNVLYPARTDGFGFTLDGETGRYYRIESSTDLVSWLPEVSFAFSQPVTHDGYGSTPFTSVVYNTNSTISLVVPENTASKFVRTSAYVAPNEICNNNLKQIQFAKELWSRNSNVSRIAIPTVVDLMPYLSSNFSFYTSCPSGGFYHIDDVRTPPACTVPEHVLEEPR